MKLCFDSIEETKEFVAQLKGTRGGKKGDGDDGGAQTGQAGGAPAPLAPPGGAAQGFNPGGAPQGGFNPGAGTAQQGVDPAVQAIVGRIVARIDGAIAAGQPADQVLAWFRGQCGPEAANATMDQIKTACLPKAPMPTLENIAKLMNA